MVILAIGMITALTVSPFTVISASAKKRHCDKTDTGCESIKVENKQSSLDGNQSSIPTAHGENDSNMVDEPTSLDESKIQLNNSSSSIDSQTENPFALPLT